MKAVTRTRSAPIVFVAVWMLAQNQDFFDVIEEQMETFGQMDACAVPHSWWPHKDEVLQVLREYSKRNHPDMLRDTGKVQTPVRCSSEGTNDIRDRVNNLESMCLHVCCRLFMCRLFMQKTYVFYWVSLSCQ